MDKSLMHCKTDNILKNINDKKKESGSPLVKLGIGTK